MKYRSTLAFGHDQTGNYAKGDAWRGDEAEGARLRGLGYLESDATAPAAANPEPAAAAKPKGGKGGKGAAQTEMPEG